MPEVSLVPYLVCVNSEGSRETAQMRRLNLCRLAWTFAVHLCVKYPFLMSWFSMLEEIYTALMRFELEYSKTNTMTYTQREDADQLAHLTGLIRVIAGYSMDSQWLGTAKTLIKLCRFQAHQSLCWMYMSFCSFFLRPLWSSSVLFKVHTRENMSLFSEITTTSSVLNKNCNISILGN